MVCFVTWWDVSDIFYFFLVRRGRRKGRRRPRRWSGGAGSNKNRGRGGVDPRKTRGRGKGAGGMSVGRGGGLNIFFRGRNVHQGECLVNLQTLKCLFPIFFCSLGCFVLVYLCLEG